MKQRIYIDMDGVLCNFLKRYLEIRAAFPDVIYPQSVDGFFKSLEEIPGGIDAVKLLAEDNDVWILTRPSFKNPLCYTEKRLWIEEHLGIEWCEKLIICPDKSLMIGEYFISNDQPWHKFNGEQILFGSNKYSSWSSVIDYLAPQKKGLLISERET